MRIQVESMNWPSPVAEESGFLAFARPPDSTMMMRCTSCEVAESAPSGRSTSAVSGSTARPFSMSSKWRCGPVDWPVVPT